MCIWVCCIVCCRQYTCSCIGTRLLQPLPKKHLAQTLDLQYMHHMHRRRDVYLGMLHRMLPTIHLFMHWNALASAAAKTASSANGIICISDVMCIRVCCIVCCRQYTCSCIGTRLLQQLPKQHLVQTFDLQYMHHMHQRRDVYLGMLHRMLPTIHLFMHSNALASAAAKTAYSACA
jgi:hypothetical protein